MRRRNFPGTHTLLFSTKDLVVSGIFQVLGDLEILLFFSFNVHYMYDDFFLKKINKLLSHT